MRQSDHDQATANFAVAAGGEGIAPVDEVPLLRPDNPAFTQVLQTLPVGCMLLSSRPPASFTFLNTSFTRITGYTPQDLPTYDDWIRQAYPELAYREQVVASWGDGDTPDGNAGRLRRIVCKDGVARLVQIAVRQLSSGAVLMTVSDAANQAGVGQALQDSEQKYSNLFHQSHDAIVVHDLDGAILDVNRSALDLFGYEQDEMLALRIDCLHPRDHAEVYRRAFRTVSEAGHARFSVRFLRKDGSSFPSEVSSSLFEAAGRRLVQCIVRDMTEQIAADGYRRELEDRLRHMQKMEAVGELAGGVAHDFNNMLTVIMGNAELLQMSLQHSPDRALVDQVLTASRRAAELTGQLLAFARRGSFAPQVVDVHDVIQDVHALLLHAVDRKIEIKMELGARASLVMADPGFLQTALLNLGLNGRDAMPEGGTIVYRSSNVRLTKKRTTDTGFELNPGEYLEVSVTDSGCGIAPELRDRVFEPFFTTKETGKGTGMGLASVYGCAKRHGGSIELESRKGGGSIFRLRLPVTTATENVIASPPPREFLSGDGHILVVDDEEMVRNFAATAMRSLGYSVSTAADGDDAVTFYREQWPQIDLVVLDLVMPHMNGEEAFEAFKRINPNVRVLVATGYAEQDVADRLGAAGVAGFVSKPFRIDELARKIHANIRV